MNKRATDALVALRRIQRRVEIDTRRLAHAVDLTPSQLFVLQILAERGETSTGDIVKATQLSNATITSLVDKIVEKGMVTRRRCDEDRRRVWLTLQPAGQKALEDAPDTIQALFQTGFAELAEWEQAMLVAALERVSGLLGADDIDAAPILTSGGIDGKGE